MSRQFNFVVVALLGVGLAASSVAGWSYEPVEEQSTWKDTYPNCGGERQSPIDLCDFTETSSPDLTWSGYSTVPKSMTLANSGHSVSLKSSGSTPRVTLGGKKIFQLDGVHFHWGKRNREGSEHSVCGVKYALEMHAVHKRVLANGTLVSPMEIIVITSLFRFSRHSQAADEGLNYFVQSIPKVVHYNTSTPIPPFAWSKLIYKFTEDFVWYEGSLTTPPCSEVVTFFVNRPTRRVTNDQLMPFRLLLNEENEPIAGNTRSIQPRNGREIHFYSGS